MRHLHLAELRSSWPAWLGVSVGFIVINFSLSLCALVILSGLNAIDAKVMRLEDSAAFTLTTAFQLVVCVIVAMSVINASTSLVVDARRAWLARLALAGASPGQVIGTIMTQLAAVSLASAVIGGVLAMAALPTALLYLAAERGAEVPVPEAVYAFWPLAAASLLSIGVAVLGGYRQAHLATNIPPVEALRLAVGARRERMGVLRWLGAGFTLLVIVAIGVALPLLTANRNKETVSNVLQLAFLLLFMMALLFAFLAPVIVGPVTRAWTKLVPSFDPSWDLARTTAVVKADRLSKSVIPVMTAIALIFGMIGISETLNASMAASGFDLALEHVGALSFITILGLPLAIAVSGGVGALVMMSKQRDAELALSGIVGTTPGQRLAMPVMEGAIIAVTGAVLGLVCAAVSIVYMGAAFPLVELEWGFSLPVAELLGAFALAALVTIAATTLPTLPSLRRPEPKVIARLVAE